MPTPTPIQNGQLYHIGLGSWNNCSPNGWSGSAPCDSATKAYQTVDDMEAAMELAFQLAGNRQPFPLIRYGLHYDPVGATYPSGNHFSESATCGGSAGSCEDLDYRAGRTPVISYFGQGGTNNAFLAVVNGNYNSQLTARAEAYVDAFESSSYGNKTIGVIVRPWWEFNGNQQGSGGSQSLGSNFIPAWDYVVKFQNNVINSYCASKYPGDWPNTCNAGNVITWFWCGSIGSDFTNNPSAFYSYYPGNAYLESAAYDVTSVSSTPPPGYTGTPNPGLVGGDGYDRYGNGFLGSLQDGYNIITRAATNCSLTPSGCINGSIPIAIGETGAQWGNSSPPCNVKETPPTQGTFFNDFGSKQASVKAAMSRLLFVDYFSSDTNPSSGVYNCWGLLQYATHPNVANLALNFYQP